MFESIKSILLNWNLTTNERQKLQHSYLAITAIVIIVAGIFSLLNAKLGHRIVYIAMVAIGAYLVNAVVWNLLKSSFISKLPSRRSSKK